MKNETNPPKKAIEQVKSAVAEFEKNDFETLALRFQIEKTKEFFDYCPNKERLFEEKYNPDLTDERKEQFDEAFGKLIDNLEDAGIKTLLIKGRLKEGGHLILMTTEGFKTNQEEINMLAKIETTKH